MGLFFNNQDIANAGVTEKAVLYSRSRFSCEPSEIGAAKPDGARLLREAPAAFRRLCVETFNDVIYQAKKKAQPPSGGCVLKLSQTAPVITAEGQPPSGGCVLKPIRKDIKQSMNNQPPSGGCVLKQMTINKSALNASQPPSGGCVLKHRTAQ